MKQNKTIRTNHARNQNHMDYTHKKIKGWTYVFVKPYGPFM